MTEYLDYIVFAIRTVGDAREAAAFHSSLAGSLKPELTGTLTVKHEELAHDLDIHSDANGIFVSFDLTSFDEETQARLAALEGPHDLVRWMEAVDADAAYLEAAINVSYAKLQDKASGVLVAYTREGLDEARGFVRKLRLDGAPVPPLTLRTPLVRATHVGEGVLIAPLASLRVSASSKTFLVPSDVPDVLVEFAAAVQADHVGLALLERDLGIQPRVSLAKVRDLAKWLQSEELLPIIGRELVRERPPSATDQGLDAFADELRIVKSDLVGKRLRDFEAAKAGFREVSAELLRDLHSMRAEILTLAGTDLFQTSLTIAVTVAGLELSDLLDLSWSVALGILVGLLFFVGSLAKAVTHELEFRQLARFNEKFQRLPIAESIPEIRDWYVRTVNQSIQAFYATLSLGFVVSGVPLFGIVSVWLSLRFPEGWSASAFFGLLVGAAAIVAIGYWSFGPRRSLLIDPQTDAARIGPSVGVSGGPATRGEGS